MILVLGGTTEGRSAVQVLEESGATYYYSTRGEAQDVPLVHGLRVTGAMDQEAIVDFCRQHDIRLLVDAAHPFAVQVHRNMLLAARRLHLPVVRYERQYPPHTDCFTWCDDYDDAVSKLRKAGITRLLALTGVQTIGRLRDYWTQNECWFRILNRDDSHAIAARQGFPADHLVYYEENTTAELLRTVSPQAILTKESGRSGGFDEKVGAARQAGVQVFVVCRPDFGEAWKAENNTTVEGPHGLRRAVEKLLPAFFPLKTGLTTGTCATAAAMAALTGARTVSVLLPDGEHIDVDIAHVDGRTATVVKDAGDDPDVTDGLAISATVALSEPSGGLRTDTTDRIRIRGGEGVGTVTLPGLGLPIGSAAVNETPRRMIRENLAPLLAPQQVADVTISVPRGREIAARTFNPRIGVVGGISIIGTSGIVKPFSSDAWISSIRKEMAVGLALTAQLALDGQPQVVINSGARSVQFLRTRYPELPEQAFVHYGNFIGETIRIAAEQGVSHLAMGLMIGKAVKLAEGNLDTHSHKVTMNRGFVLTMAAEAGVSCLEELSRKLPGMNMARELWDLLPAEDMRRLADVILSHCHHHCDPLLPEGRLDILLVSERGEIVCS